MPLPHYLAYPGPDMLHNLPAQKPVYFYPLARQYGLTQTLLIVKQRLDMTICQLISMIVTDVAQLSFSAITPTARTQLPPLFPPFLPCDTFQSVCLEHTKSTSGHSTKQVILVFFYTMILQSMNNFSTHVCPFKSISTN